MAAGAQRSQCPALPEWPPDGVIADDPELRAQIEAKTPLRRLGTVQDVAAAVVYLASAAAGYLTGTVLEVAGGAESPATGQSLPDL